MNRESSFNILPTEHNICNEYDHLNALELVFGHHESKENQE